jgi:pyridoxine kinase
MKIIMLRILSIQSHVTFGHVGNSAVTFPLQILGHDVWPVPTAVLSNHAGYRELGGEVLSADTVQNILDGLVPRGVHSDCDLVLTGYLGSIGVGQVALRTVAQLRDAKVTVLYCCDPVIGDRDGGVYVADGLTAFFRDVALPAANILTPNQFELELLAGCSTGALDGAPLADTVAAARVLLERIQPGGCVLVTSVVVQGAGVEHTAMVAVDARDAWIVEAPRFVFTLPPHGAGDLVAALFAARYAQSGLVSDALEDCAARLHAVFAETAKRDSAELEIIAARAMITSPMMRFEVRPLN